MLTNGVMGAVALAIFWVNVLLIAAATGKQLRALLARHASLGGVVRGQVARGDGPAGAFATHHVEQVGRAALDGTSILFNDRRAWGEVSGGALVTAAGETLDVPPAAEAEVWLEADRLARAGACTSNDELDQALASARKAQGFKRTVAAPLGEGAEVFFAPPAGDHVALVATMDPRALLAKKVAVGAGFIVAELAAAAGCTAVALRPPVFGAVSTVGGVLCLGFFLAVQPAGTMVHDALVVPSRAFVRGRWARRG
jgi:hypothetical protein